MVLCWKLHLLQETSIILSSACWILYCASSLPSSRPGYMGCSLFSKGRCGYSYLYELCSYLLILKELCECWFLQILVTISLKGSFSSLLPFHAGRVVTFILLIPRSTQPTLTCMDIQTCAPQDCETNLPSSKARSGLRFRNSNFWLLVFHVWGRSVFSLLFYLVHAVF